MLAVDLDPQAVRTWAQKGYRVRYGDVSDQEFWTDLPLGQARWIVMAVPYGTILLTETDPKSGLLAALRSHRFNGRVAITARDDREGSRFQEQGVDLVLYPFDDAAAAALSQIVALEDEAPPERAGREAERVRCRRDAVACAGRPGRPDRAGPSGERSHVEAGHRRYPS